MNSSGGPAAKHNEAAALVAQMSAQEKSEFCSGRNFWHLQGSERLDIASVMVTDGPHGLRKQNTAADHVGLNKSVPATCFPTACALAASWDIGLLQDVGVALGEQCVAENVAVLLGPGMNIKRHPLCGRNFEYFSEDPLLTGEIAAALINGVQSQGVGTSVKHFAVNNQEYGRMFVDAIVDERTLREIYLRGFEIAVRKAQPWTVMCAYNRINGEYCSEHDWLLNKVLRDEWGFRGLVMTDWGATNDRVLGVANGLDLEMPGSGGINDARVLEALNSGELAEVDLDRAIVRNVALSLSGADLAQREVNLDHQAHHELAKRAAIESTVLLKNQNDLLPLQANASVAVIGEFAKKPRYQGTGSSQVAPTQLDGAFDAMLAIGAEGGLSYTPGYDARTSVVDDALIAEAVQLAKSADVAVVFAGLPVSYESEGFDRAHMHLPDQHNKLIEAVCAANANTVVVLSNGAPVQMPWVDDVPTIVEGYLAGQAGGPAIADVLFGLANPSGKLAETFPLEQAHVAADEWFPGENRQVQYREGLYVGYRYFDSAEVPVLFSFGHGLSYTKFEYGALQVSETPDGWQVTMQLTNVGSCAGAEVVQLYVHALASSVYRPQQELRAFTKVMLQAGESSEVVLALDDAAFSYYDVQAKDWLVQAGTFEIRVGASSRDIRQKGNVQVESSDQVPQSTSQVSGPVLGGDGMQVDDAQFAAMLGKVVPAPEQVKPFHLNSSLAEIAQTWLGKRIRDRAVLQFQGNVGAKSADPTLAKMFEEMANAMPLRALPLFSGGKMDFKAVHVLVALLNHRYVEAMRLQFGGKSEWK